MATVNFSFGTHEYPAHLSGSSLPSSADARLFRFRLRHLLLAFVAASVFFAAMALSHGMAGPAILLAIIVIFMHVFATSLGTKLRDRADNLHAFEAANRFSAETVASAPERTACLSAIQSQARSPWHARGATALPWLRAIVAIAFAAGALAGSSYLAFTIGYRTSPAGVVVGGISFAVLFGWFAFLFGSFYGVFRHGFREAIAEQARDSR